MLYCPNCGNKATDDMLFCTQCGTRLIIPKAGFKDNKTVKISDYTTEVNTTKPETIGHGIKKDKLYRQWIEYADLPSDEIPPTKTPRDMPIRGQPSKQHPDALYILLVVIILILCVGLALLLMKPG